MKALLSLLFAFVATISAFGQQAQEDLRTDRQLVFPTFRKAKVLQTFGRSITAEANVLYRDGALCFIDPADGKVRKVANASVLGAVFDDSIRYEKVDGAMMGRVVATQGYNKLLCVTTIDMDRYRELTTGSTDLPFVSLDSGGALPDLFMDLSGTEQRANKGYPLKRTYYFSLRGKIVPAKERLVKKVVREDMKLAFKNLMDDRWWSWGDQKSLQRLLMYFPEGVAPRPLWHMARRGAGFFMPTRPDETAAATSNLCLRFFSLLPSSARCTVAGSVSRWASIFCRPTVNFAPSIASIANVASTATTVRARLIPHARRWRESWSRRSSGCSARDAAPT